MCLLTVKIEKMACVAQEIMDGINMKILAITVVTAANML